MHYTHRQKTTVPKKMHSRASHAITTLPLLVTMAALAILSCIPQIALADPSSSDLKAEREELRYQLADLQESFEKASDNYDKILSEKRSAEDTVNRNRDEIQHNDEEIAVLQNKLGQRAEEMYKQDPLDSFLNVLFGSSSLNDLITGWNAMSAVNQHDVELVNQTKLLRADSFAKQVEAQEQELVAAQKAEEAQAIKSEGEAKVAEYESKISDLDSEIRTALMQESARELAARMQASKSVETTSGSGSGIPANGDVVDYAISRMGCPYVWAGSGPNVFDCSGLVMWCYAQTGVSLPHSSESQYACAKAVLPVSEAEPGDVLYMPGHVGIYIGGGEYIHAPTPGDVVRTSSWPMFSCALRF